VSTVEHIRPLILCRGPNCLGRTGDLDPDCPRCGGIDGPAWGIDPSSLGGCIKEDDEEPEEDED